MTESDDLLMEVLYQVCGYSGIIDNKCTSTYEDACDYLEKKGYLRKINGRIYEILVKE